MLLKWGKEKGKLLATVLPPISYLLRQANWSPLFTEISENGSNEFVLCFHTAKSLSFHSASPKGAAIARIGSFTGFLSAPKLSNVFAFCLQSIFSDSWPFALCLSETAVCFEFHQVSLCVYGFGRVQNSKWKAGIRDVGWTTTGQYHKKQNMSFTMKEERKSQQFYININNLVLNSILTQILDFSVCA